MHALGERWSVAAFFPRREHGTVSDRPVFSEDGRLLAAGHSLGALELIDLSAMRAIAVLRLPRRERVHAGGFDPAGRFLVAGTRRSLLVWDLDASRRAGVGGAPGAALVPAGARSRPLGAACETPLGIELDLGELGG
jgi:hypothetical protein